jgi:hypothetical protein
MKLRVGEAGSRFTPDLDASRSADITLDDASLVTASLRAGAASPAPSPCSTRRSRRACPRSM